MRRWWNELDRILRGEATRPSAMRDGTIEIAVGPVAAWLVALALFTGFCMSTFALFKAGGPSVWQLVASTTKVPLLFFLTLLVTFPSLYVFNALVGSRLVLTAVLRLLVAAMAVMLTVLASFGTIVAFFSLSTTSYPFMVLLNVAVFGVAGVLGLKFLLLTLHRLSVAQEELARRPEALVPRPAASEVAAVPAPPAGEPAPVLPRAAEPGGALEHLDGRVLGPHVTTVFRIWVVVFGLVGAQMAWVLRPFIGDPDTPFAWFRPRESSFFEAVFLALQSLFS